MTRRRVSASTTPIDSFGNDRSVSYAAGSTPTQPGEGLPDGLAAGRRGAAAARARARAGTSRAQRRSTRRRSRVRQFQMAFGLLETVRAYSGQRRGAAVLQALLPARGEQPERLARGGDQVHLGGRQVGDHAGGLARRGRGEELVADQPVAVPRPPAPRAAAPTRSGAARGACPGWGPHARPATPRGGRAARRPAAARRRRAAARASPTGSSGGRWSPSSAGRGG